MQFPILNGVYTDSYADFRVSYPVNLCPVPLDSGVSKGYLRPAEGAVKNTTGPGFSRGGFNWKDKCYRVLGTKFVSIDSMGQITVIGDVGAGGQCTFDNSFDRLAISAGGKLYYWDGSVFSQVTDPDLGVVLDFVWVDGYFMSTDGQFLVVTEINDPTSVNPLKYGSSEIDPDPINSVMKLRNEIYAINRYTIEVFQNVGGSYFPFQRVNGAQIQKGSLGTYCSCIFLETIAFLGGGRNEAPGVFLGVNATATKISDKEIDTILQGYTLDQLSTSFMEIRNIKGQNQLLIHLPDQTLVYDAKASQLVGEPVWFILISGTYGNSQYLVRDHVWCYNEWLVANPAGLECGTLSESTGSQWGNPVRWEFGTQMIYNEGRGAIIHELELIAVTGRIENGKDPTISTSYSLDGISWSQERFIKAGKTGDRLKRLIWLQNGSMKRFRLQRFKGTSDAFISIARLEARLEPLSV